MVRKFSRETSSEGGIVSSSLWATPKYNNKSEIEVSLFTQYFKRTVALLTENELVRV